MHLHSLSGSALFPVPPWKLILSPSPWSLLTPPPRPFFPDHSSPRPPLQGCITSFMVPICISRVVSCKQKKGSCADLSSSGIYRKTHSTQNGQLQDTGDTGRNKERQHSQNHGQIHAIAAVQWGHQVPRWVQSSRWRWMLLLCSFAQFRSWADAPDWLNLSHIPLQ